MNILADASLPGLIEAFPPPFKLTFYKDNEEVKNLLIGQDILLCRANLKVNQSLLTHHSLRYVATASSGSDNLEHSFLQTQHIIPIDAKGCNAVAVADYVISSLAYLEQINLVQGKTVGIIGMGYVGSEVHGRLQKTDFKLLCYDPPKAEKDGTFFTCSQKELHQCDVICIHAELHQKQPHPSFGLINEHLLTQLKPGCIIINASRGGIVDENALLNIRANQTDLIYCTDVFLNEPQLNKALITHSTLCTPHIAGHSLEAKFNAVATVSQKLHRLLALPLPSYARPGQPAPLTHHNLSWQELALMIYNPFNETQALKKTTDLAATFIQLRKNHNNRHNFSAYLNEHTKLENKEILGMKE